MALNLERGFRRITLIVSLLVLVVAGSFAVLMVADSWGDWYRALRPRTGQRIVYIESRGVIEFPSGTSDREIKRMLDAMSPDDIVGRLSPRTSLFRREEGPPKEARAGGDPFSFTEFQRFKEAYLTCANSPDLDSISLVYLPTMNQGASVLYSRWNLLGPASGELPSRAKKVLDEIHPGWCFPAPPPRVPLIWPLVAALGAAATPWGAFLVVRWVVRGFTPTS